MSEKLTLLLRKIIREEIRTELELLKKDILIELRKNSVKTSVITEATHTHQTQPKSSPKLPPNKPNIFATTKKPLATSTGKSTTTIADILASTEPLSASEVYENHYDGLEPVRQSTKNPNMPIQEHVRVSNTPIVTTGPQGEPIDLRKPEVKKVLNIMNMNFSDKLKAMDEAAKSFRQ